MMNTTTVDINFSELCGKLRSMKLSSMADTLEKQLANPNSGLQSFDERISEIICSEWDTRYNKKFNRFLKKATLKYPAADIDESIYDADCIWRVPTAGFAEQNGRNAKLNSR